MQIEDVFSRVLGYNSDQDHELRNEDDEIAKWLDKHPETWRVSRLPDIPIEPNPIVYLLVGQEGYGKTTALREVAEHIAKDPVNLPLLLDFTDASIVGSDWSKLVSDAGWKAYVRRLGKKVKGDVERQIRQRHLFREYKATWAKDAAINYNGVNTAVDEMWDTMDEEDLLSMSADEVLAHPVLKKLLNSSRNHVGDIGSHVLRVAALIPGVRLFVQIDNIDHLPKETIARTLFELLNMITNTTVCHIAIRNENAHLYVESRHSVETRVPDFDQDGTFLKIGRRRIEAAVEYVRTHQPENIREASDRAKILRRQLTRIDGDRQTLNLLQKWQNENLRQILSFVGTLWDESPFPNSPSSIRGLVFHRLIFEATPPYLFHIFDPRRIKTHKFPNVRFVFLHLRILSYLNHLPEPHSCLLSEMVSRFEESFGIQEDDMNIAVKGLTWKIANGTAPLRVNNADADDTNIHLLPAGEVFMDQVVHSVDFLSWVYDHSTSSLPEVSPGGRRQTKLDKAAVVLREDLLSAFFDEHPYMNSRRHASQEEKERLASYQRMFGFKAEHWFLSETITVLEAYANQRGLNKMQLKDTEEKIVPKLRQLDRVARGEA